MKKKEKVKQYNEMLQRYIDNKEFVRIFRTIYEKEVNVSGLILTTSHNFLLIQLDNDFIFDGYVVIRQDDFDSITSNKWDKTKKRIFEAEGKFDMNDVENNISLTSWREMIQDLKRYNYHVIIESTNKNKGCLDFFIGPIKKIEKNNVRIHSYSPTGKFDKKPTTIKFRDIKSIKFGDRYSTTFRKYLKE